MLNLIVEEAIPLLQRGGVIAYPTEAVYGLGCSPFNEAAVVSIQALKGREAHKGFIILIADWSQLFPLIDSVTEAQLARVRETWPGFVTWVFPKATSLPTWLTSDRDSIAIRMSAHPIARALAVAAPIISTSANVSGQPPATTKDAVLQQFPHGIDGIVQGALGASIKPSPIYDVRNGLQFRA